MLKVSEYRARAKQCEEMAARAASKDIREGLLNMAKAWAELADERERFLANQKTAG
jgi:hypothetical protein